MSIGGLIVSLVVVVLLLVYVLRPFFQRAEALDPAEAVDERVIARQRERLEVYYQRVLRNLHDLDEDYALGKLAEDDYRADRAVWAGRGVEVLKRLDQLDGQHLVAPAGADDAEIDAAIAGSVEAENQPVRM